MGQFLARDLQPAAVSSLQADVARVRGRSDPECRVRDADRVGLVRDDFRGKSIVNSIIDLPFALPTIVAGLTLLALYGPRAVQRGSTSRTRRPP